MNALFVLIGLAIGLALGIWGMRSWRKLQSDELQQMKQTYQRLTGTLPMQGGRRYDIITIDGGTTWYHLLPSQGDKGLVIDCPVEPSLLQQILAREQEVIMARHQGGPLSWPVITG